MKKQIACWTWSFFLLVANLVLTYAASAQEYAPQRETSLQYLREDVAFLADDSLEGRETGTRGEALAADYVANRFKAVGLAPGSGDSWLQVFEFQHNANPHAPASEGEPRTGSNVVGLIDNDAAHSVIIGAHYDHLGYGGLGSRERGDSLIHNGADDNASGVAALFEIARQLQAFDGHRNNYFFVAFSGEELGLLGSKYFVRNAPLPIDQINYMINLDMVGRLNTERALAVHGTGTSPDWEEALANAADAAGLNIKQHASGLGPSDHASFYLENIPVLHLFTGQHDEYHKSSDDSHLINYEGLFDIASFTVDVIESLNDNDALTFTETQDQSQESRTSFKVSLGIMPDYVYDGKGLRLDAVLDGRPAADAGLEKGDVIVQLGVVDVTDIYSYMEALSHHETGDVVTISVQRGDKIIKREVRF